MQTSFFTTINDLRDKFYKQLSDKKKIECPCCNRSAQKYKRTITIDIAEQLIKGYKEHEKGREYFHYTDVSSKKGSGPGSFTHAKWWNLIERQEGDDDSKRESGMWKLTTDGTNFIRGFIQIPKYIWTYNNNVVTVSSRTIKINDVVNRFHYGKLMRGEY